MCKLSVNAGGPFISPLKQETNGDQIIEFLFFAQLNGDLISWSLVDARNQFRPSKVRVNVSLYVVSSVLRQCSMHASLFTSQVKIRLLLNI